MKKFVKKLKNREELEKLIKHKGLEKDERNLVYILLSFSIFCLVFFFLNPYFTKNFSVLREKVEIELARQKLIKEEKEKKKQEEKDYLMGKFSPSKRLDFVRIPVRYTVGLSDVYLRKETYDAFTSMREEAARDGIRLIVASATRNFNYQKTYWNNKWRGATLVEGGKLPETIPNGKERFRKILEYSSVPGTSRHHWGTDIDLNNANPEYFDTVEGVEVYNWLVENASDYGFCQVYDLRNSERPTGYNEEKWHWSYLPLAKNFTDEYKDLIKENEIKGFLGDEYAKDFDLINDYVLGINPECL